MNEEQMQSPTRQNPDNVETSQATKYTTYQQENSMNQDQFKGKFDQLKGKIKQAYGRLSDDDIALYNGKQDEFYGKLEEKYGLIREEAQERLEEMERQVA